MTRMIDDQIAESAATDGQYAMAYALLRVAEALRDLGNADAGTPMGAIEALGKALREGCNDIAVAIETRELDTRRDD